MVRGQEDEGVDVFLADEPGNEVQLATLGYAPPTKYPDGTNCTWRVHTSSEDKRVRLEFLAFDVSYMILNILLH